MSSYVLMEIAQYGNQDGKFFDGRRECKFDGALVARSSSSDEQYGNQDGKFFDGRL